MILVEIRDISPIRAFCIVFGKRKNFLQKHLNAFVLCKKRPKTSKTEFGSNQIFCTSTGWHWEKHTFRLL